MINDLSVLARVREREIRGQVRARQHRPDLGRNRRNLSRRLVRSALARLGSALVVVGRRLEISMMEERPQHGS